MRAMAMPNGKEVKFKAAKAPENTKKKFDRSWNKVEAKPAKAVDEVKPEKPAAETKVHPKKGKPAATGIKHCDACNQDYKPTSNAQRYHNEECKNILTGQAVTRIVENIVTAPDPENPKISHYMRKKLEEKAAKEEQELLNSMRDNSKIDWKKVETREKKYMTENVSI